MLVNNIGIVIICIHRSPKGNFDVFVSRMIGHRSYVVLCGDINIDFLVDSPEKIRIEQILLLISKRRGFSSY